MKNVIGLFYTSVLFLAMSATHPLLGANWVGPITVFTALYAQNPVVGTDEAGNAVILAQRSDDLTNFYEQGAQLVQGVVQNLHKFLPSGSNTIPPNSPTNLVNSIAVNANGNAALLWVEATASNDFFTRGAVLTNNSWGTPSVLSNPVDQEDTASSIGVTLDDNTHAISAWATGNGMHNDAQVSQYVPPNWQSEQTLFSSSDIVSGIYISGSPTGQALLIYAENTTPATIRGSYYDGSTWNTQIISTDGFSACNPPMSVSMNALNQAMVIWQNTSIGGVSSLFFSGGVFGGGTQTVYTPAVGEQIREMVVALDDSGNAIALWTTLDISNIFRIMTSRYSGGSWVTPLTLDSGSSANNLVTYPNVGVDQRGNAYAVWEKDDTLGTGAIYYSQYTQATNSWSSNGLISTTGISSTAPNLSVSRLGGATVVWAVDPAIQAAYVVNSIPFSPQNLTGKQVKNHFLTQTDISNVLKWTERATSSVVSYTITRNGKQIAVVPANGPLVYIDHNRRKGKVYIYEVTAVNSNGVLSDPATVTIR